MMRGFTAWAAVAWLCFCACGPTGTPRPRVESQARLTFDRARAALARGANHEAAALLDGILRDDPESGLAPRALTLRLRLVEGGEPDIRHYLSELRRSAEGTSLEEPVLYAEAQSLEREERLTEARDRFLLLADRFPYPKGAYWDDALWHAADLEVRLGRPRDAVRVLKSLLAERERSSFVGSYERPRYAAAQLRIAELYRDQLQDPERARTEFRALWREFPNSVLRDDAKWQEAVLAHRQGDSRAACAAAETLRREVSTSRYVRCVQLVCPELSPGTHERCPSYIRASLEGGGG